MSYRIFIKKRVGKWEPSGALRCRPVEARELGRSATEFTDGKHYWFCGFGTTSPKFRHSYEAYGWFLEQLEQEELGL